MPSADKFEENIALLKPTVQSSESQYRDSRKPQGSNANSGVKTGGFGFHTEFEFAPWWIVDLLNIYDIDRIVVFNRQDAASERLRTLTVSVSADVLGPWNEVYKSKVGYASEIIVSPLMLRLEPKVAARYIRLHLSEKTALHVDEVEVFGSISDPSSQQTIPSTPGQTAFPSAIDEFEEWRDVWNWSKFRAHHKLKNLELARRPGAAQVRPTIEIQDSKAFDGTISTLRLLRYGRFGNNFYQIVNACLLAQAMKASVVQIPNIDHGPDKLPIDVGCIQIAGDSSNLARGAVLTGQFYYPQGLEALVGSYDAEFLANTIRRFLFPIYARYLAEVGSLDEQTLTMHFRGGDIFMPKVNACWYVQPPASYYIRAYENACQRFGINSVLLVYEDMTNPAVEIVINHLKNLGVLVRTQSASLFLDIVTLMSSHQIVASFGTFCEAAAFLSPRIRSYYSFRRTSSQRLLKFWAQGRLGDVLRDKGVNTFVIDDPDGSFIEPETWINSPEQNDLIRQYPINRLRIMESVT
jgi:hypothetical protein